jgi:hypothetical protein
MEKGGQEPLSKPSQMVKEGQSCMLEQRRVIMAVTHMLDSGTLDERSSRLLEQLAGCIRCRPTEAAHGSEADPEAAPQPLPQGRSQQRLIHQRNWEWNQIPIAPPGNQQRRESS